MLKLNLTSTESTNGATGTAQIKEQINFNLDMLSSMLYGVNVSTPGSWLHPHQVDNFIQISENNDAPDPSPIARGTAGNGRIVEFSAKDIAGTLVECNLEGSNYQTPIDFIEIKRIDKGQADFPTKEMWQKIFDLNNGGEYCIAPNGSLFASYGTNENLTLQFQNLDMLSSVLNNNEFFALNYSINFHFNMNNAPVFCVVDPVVQIRSSD